MSKDEFPPTLTSEMVLHQTFEFMEEWKSRLYDMLSFNTAVQVIPLPSRLLEQLSFTFTFSNLFSFFVAGTSLAHTTAPKGCKTVPLIRSQCLLQLQLAQQKR